MELLKEILVLVFRDRRRFQRGNRIGALPRTLYVYCLLLQRVIVIRRVYRVMNSHFPLNCPKRSLHSRKERKISHGPQMTSGVPQKGLQLRIHDCDSLVLSEASLSLHRKPL